MKKLLSILLAVLMVSSMAFVAMADEDMGDWQGPIPDFEQNEGSEGGNDNQGTEPGEGNDEGTEPGEGDDEGTEPGEGDDEGTEPGEGDDEGTEPGEGDDEGTETESKPAAQPAKKTSSSKSSMPKTGDASMSIVALLSLMGVAVCTARKAHNM